MGEAETGIVIHSSRNTSWSFINSYLYEHSFSRRKKSGQGKVTETWRTLVLCDKVTFLFLLMSWAAAIAPYVSIEHWFVRWMHSFSTRILQPPQKLTSANPSFCYQHLSLCINSGDRTKFRYRPLNPAWCKWAYAAPASVISWEEIIPTTSSLTTSADCILHIYRYPGERWGEMHCWWVI